MTSTLRYTAQNVVSDPNLSILAKRYLLQYNGDFAFLRAAKQIVVNGEFFHPGVVKGVLNCMLADPSVGEMPEPIRVTFEPEHFYPMPEFSGPTKIRRKHQAAPVVQVEWELKLPFVTSTQFTARKIHLAEKRRDYAEYIRSDNSIINLRARQVCAPTWPAHPIMLNLYQALELIVAGEREMCHTCDRFAEHELMTTLTLYESSLALPENPLPEYVTRYDIPER